MGGDGRTRGEPVASGGGVDPVPRREPTGVRTAPAPSPLDLVHELEAQQAGLELQNEELRRRIEELAGHNQRLEESLRQLVLVEKLAAIGQLAAGVAHEVNNPLTCVVSNLYLIEGYLEALLDPRRIPGTGGAGPGPPGPALREVDELRREFLQGLAEAKEGAERVTQVVRDLMAFARPEGGGLQTVEVHDLVEGALRELEAGRGRIATEYGPGPVRLTCRPSQVVRVLRSVLENAELATGPSGTITIRTGLDGGDAWIEIEDTGVGIAPKDLGRVFEPYFTTRQVGAGTGMGLAIAHAIVQGYGGRFEVRSALGVGSTFRIVLPAAGGGDEGGSGGGAPPLAERGR